MLSWIPYHFTVAGYTLGAFHIAVIISLLYYSSISLSAAAIMGISIAAGTVLWNLVTKDIKDTDIRNIVIVLFVGGWIAQFIGHGVF